MVWTTSSAQRHVGPLSLGALVLLVALLWYAGRPAGEPDGSFLGQLLGVEAVLLMSLGMVLISTLPWVEGWFDGIDKAAVWHRRVAITGLVLLLPHILLSHGGSGASWAGPAGVVATVGLVTLAVWAILPRWRSVIPAPGRRFIEAVHDSPPARVVAWLLGNYEIWRQVHRLTGLFLAIGVAHGLSDGTPFTDAPLLRWTYLLLSGTGLGFYLYRELLARRGHGLRDYQVSNVESVGDGMTEIALRPLGRPLRYSPGQFAMLHLESKTGWHRHPFTLASSPADPTVRVTVKALGDYTRSLADEVRVGMPAVLSGPHGRFTHAKHDESGAGHQLWVAGGVGITPFLSWVRSLDTHPPTGPVDLFHAVRDDAPYDRELRRLTAAHPQVQYHLVRSTADGRLTVDQLLAATSAAPTTLSVFMCGPEALIRDLTTGLRHAGVPASRIHREYFDWR